MSDPNAVVPDRGSEQPVANEGREMIALEGVTVVRGDQKLLDEVDWRVDSHQHWVMLGPNGAGKTSMLQVASTYLGPTYGTVRILGATRGKVDVRDLRLRIGYAGSSPASMVRGQLTAVDIVVTGKHAAFVDTRWHEYEDADWERARQLLVTLDAADLADRKFGTLSAGEKQRVMIARSLMPDPEILLLDEAMTGLDLGARERLVSSLAALADDPTSPVVVLVTHHVEEIPQGFDHIAIMAGGKVTAQGPVVDVLTAESLSECFEQPLKVERRDGRYHAWSAAKSS